MNNNIIIFDFDMTLVNSLKVITEGINLIAEKFNLEKKTEAEVKAQISLDTKAFWQAIWGDFQEEWLEYFQENIKTISDGKLELYPGAEELVSELFELGARLALATNRSRAWPALNSVKLAKYFDTAVGVSDEVNPKPSPDMLFLVLKQLGANHHQAIYIGDALCDMQAAKIAGIRGIGLTQGGNTKAALMAAGAWKVCDNLQEVKKILF